MPAHGAQFGLDAFVARPVAGNLGLPPFAAGFRQLARREGTARDEIAHPLTFLVFNDNAHLASLRLLEAQANLLLTRPKSELYVFGSCPVGKKISA